MTTTETKSKSPQPALNDYEPLLLSTQELINAHWETAAPLLQKCLDKGGDEEATLEDLYEKLIMGQAFMFVCRADTVDGPDVKLAIILNIVRYPRLDVLNVMALGGSALQHFRDRFWKAVCGWAYMNGARALEGHVPSRGMQKILKNFGFEPVSVLMRFPLTGE